MAEKEYIKLTPVRRKTGFAIFTIARSNLWLGKDHLLSVETEGYTERYRRFYFRDIQAIIARRTNRALVIGLVTGTLMALFGVFSAVSDSIEGRWILGVVAAVFAIPFFINIAYGPTCACELRTAVQTEKVPSLSRVRRVRSVMNRLRPLIAAAQGQLSAEEVTGNFQTLLVAASTGTTATSGPSVAAAESAAPSEPGG